jgi:hypothetical protein
VDAIRRNDPVASFGFAYSIAVTLIAMVDAVTVLIPGLEEQAEQTLGPAWLYMGMLGIISFGTLRLLGLGRTSSRRKVALAMIGSTIFAGLVIVAAGARAGLTGSMGRAAGSTLDASLTPIILIL